MHQMHEPKPTRVINNVPIFHNIEEDSQIARKASFRLRLIAYIIDTTFQTTLFALNKSIFLIFIEKQSLFALGHQVEFQFLTYFLTLCLYSFYPLYKHGQTIGKKAVGIQLVNEDPLKKISLFSIIMREYFAKPLSTLPLFFGFIIARFNSESKTLHDYICRTKVISCKNL